MHFVKQYPFLIIAIGSLLSSECFADSKPDALLGNQGSAPYAAFLKKDGSIKNLKGLPSAGITFRVAMNESGEGLIGGTDGVNAYTAFVAPNGKLTSLTGLMAPGEIYTVAINKSGKGIFGGGNFVLNTTYAAFAKKDGTVTPFTLPASGLIYSAAIDKSGKGIIGGIGPGASAYAATIAKDGTVTPVTGLPASGGIFWVGTNNAGKKLIGGNDGPAVYAAFISPEDVLMPISGLPSGQVYNVAINKKGAGIIGGKASNLPYAALISKNGSVTTLKGLPSSAGIIYNVAINKSGAGMIAGFSASGPFGAFVAPDGTLTTLKGLPEGPGLLDGMALDPSGVAIVGGGSNDVPFAALAAPNGKLTFLSGFPADGEIDSIAIASLSGLVPESIGPFDSWANTQFAFNDALTQHAMIHHKHSSEMMRTTDEGKIVCEKRKEDHSLWLAPFGNWVKEPARHGIPKFTNEIGGALLGYDYNGIQDVTIGGGLAYAFNYVHYKRAGHTKINQESAVVYASWNRPYFYMNAALWGGIFQSTNKRRSFSFITSRAKPWGWNLTPHLEFSSPIPIAKCKKYVIDPFVTLDWVNNWQRHYHEHGSSGFNIVLNNQYASVLRSEVGVRFFETFQYGWGRLVLEEKVSYANRTPFHKRKGTAYFVGSASTFGVETINHSSQNVGIGQFHMEFLPENLSGFYGSLDYQGEFGGCLQSHMATLTMGIDF